MVRLIVGFIAPSERDATRHVETFQSLMRMTRLESGCLRCSVQVDEADRQTVHYEEEWATEGDLQRRIRSKRFSSLLALLESAAEPPKVQFNFMTTVCGLEYVAAVRGEVQ
jgi:quinol monooxygenase YgiN